MNAALLDICCASVPTEALALLAPLRTAPGVQAAVVERRAWIRWEPGDDAVLTAVLPIHGCDLFRFHEGRWHRLGRSLPTFDFPADLDYQPLAHVLFPSAVVPTAPSVLSVAPVVVTLTRDDRPRRTTALLCGLAALSAWSDTVPAGRLASLRVAFLGAEALVLGNDLPPIPSGERYWGGDVLIPLGYIPEPALPESALKEAVDLADDQMLLWRPGAAEAIERTLFARPTRAGIRLALREGLP